MYLQPFAGSTWALCQVSPMWLGAAAARVAYLATAWKWAVLIHAATWLVQFGTGHGLIERRSPALTVSLGQALGTATLFAWLEALFAVIWRPDLMAVLDRWVAEGQAALDRGLRRRKT